MNRYRLLREGHAGHGIIRAGEGPISASVTTRE